MASWETTYWRVFNILVRALGLVSFFSGTVFVVWGTLRMLQLEFIQPEAASALVILPVGLLVAILGAAIIRAPTYHAAIISLETLVVDGGSPDLRSRRRLVSFFVPSW